MRSSQLNKQRKISMKYLTILALLICSTASAGFLDNFPLNSDRNIAAAARVCTQGDIDINVYEGGNLQQCCIDMNTAVSHPQCSVEDGRNLCEIRYPVSCF